MLATTSRLRGVGKSRRVQLQPAAHSVSRRSRSAVISSGTEHASASLRALQGKTFFLDVWKSNSRRTLVDMLQSLGAIVIDFLSVSELDYFITSDAKCRKLTNRIEQLRLSNSIPEADSSKVSASSIDENLMLENIATWKCTAAGRRLHIRAASAILAAITPLCAAQASSVATTNVHHNHNHSNNNNNSSAVPVHSLQPVDQPVPFVLSAYLSRILKSRWIGGISDSLLRHGPYTPQQMTQYVTVPLIVVADCSEHYLPLCLPWKVEDPWWSAIPTPAERLQYDIDVKKSKSCSCLLKQKKKKKHSHKLKQTLLDQKTAVEPKLQGTIVEVPNSKEKETSKLVELKETEKEVAKGKERKRAGYCDFCACSYADADSHILEGRHLQLAEKLFETNVITSLFDDIDRSWQLPSCSATTSDVPGVSQTAESDCLPSLNAAQPKLPTDSQNGQITLPAPEDVTEDVLTIHTVHSNDSVSDSCAPVARVLIPQSIFFQQPACSDTAASKKDEKDDEKKNTKIERKETMEKEKENENATRRLSGGRGKLKQKAAILVTVDEEDDVFDFASGPDSDVKAPPLTTTEPSYFARIHSQAQQERRPLWQGWSVSLSSSSKMEEAETGNGKENQNQNENQNENEKEARDKESQPQPSTAVPSSITSSSWKLQSPLKATSVRVMLSPSPRKKKATPLNSSSTRFSPVRRRLDGNGAPPRSSFASLTPQIASPSKQSAQPAEDYVFSSTSDDAFAFAEKLPSPSALQHSTQTRTTQQALRRKAVAAMRYFYPDDEEDNAFQPSVQPKKKARRT
jgi:hypothetical protein